MGRASLYRSLKSSVRGLRRGGESKGSPLRLTITCSVTRAAVGGTPTREIWFGGWSPTGEWRLVEIVHPARTRVQGDLAELVKDRRGWRVHRTPRKLQAESARSAARRAQHCRAQIPQGQQEELSNLVTRGSHPRCRGATPYDHRRDGEAGASVEIVQQAENSIGLDG